MRDAKLKYLAAEAVYSNVALFKFLIFRVHEVTFYKLVLKYKWILCKIIFSFFLNLWSMGTHKIKIHVPTRVLEMILKY